MTDANLDDIARRVLRTLVPQVTWNRRAYAEVANASRLIQTDHDERFLIELIQNANDQVIRAGQIDGTVRVIWRNGRLGVLNQGAAVSAGGLDSLSQLALSDKSSPTLIGNKGVGFKAVYEVCDAPRFYSDGFRFTLPSRLAPDQVARLDQLAEEVLAEPASVALASEPDGLERLQRAVRDAPSFWFPRAASQARLLEDLNALGLNDLEGFTTLVTLPLRQGSDKKVGRAVSAVRRAETLLFLPGVARLEVETPTDGFVVTRTSTGQLADGIAVLELAMDDDVRRWWLLSGEVTDPRLPEYAKALGLQSWQDVTTAPVQVAAPIPDDRPLGSDGLYCMGLPTEKHTGLPIWVDGRFHGKTDRTDLPTSDYNDLVHTGARQLVARLLKTLRQSDQPAHRRAATLILEPGDGPLAMHDDWGPKTVLCRDNQYRAPADVWWPGETAPGLLGVLSRHATATPTQPDPVLQDHAGSVLDALGVERTEAREWLEKDDTGRSPLERSCQVLDSEAWPDLLAWLAETFHSTELEDQRVLPVEGGLAIVGDKVYLPLRDHQGLHPLVAERIRVLDAARVPTFDGRARTELGALLVKNDMVHEPGLDDLLTEALVPAMQDADDTTRWALLAQAVAWIGQLREAGRERLASLKLRLPTTGGWRRAKAVYLGTGWGERSDEHDRLLSQVYPDRRLVPWSQVVARFPDAKAQDWLSACTMLGVPDRPRFQTIPEKTPLFRAYDQRIYRSSADHVDGKPWDVALDGYRDWVAKNCSSGWVHRRDLSIELQWVDGLGSSETDSDLLALLLMHRADPDQTVETSVGTGDRWTTCPQLWVWYLQHQGLAPKPHVFRKPAGNPKWAHLAETRHDPNGDLLTGLGVTPLPESSSKKLIAGLHWLAAQIEEDRSKARTRAALSFAIELWSQLAKKATLRGLGAAPIPLECGGLEVLDPRESEFRLLVDDDAERARLLQQDGRLPTTFAPKESEAFVAALVAALGKSSVVVASKTEVSAPFADLDPPTDLMKWLIKTHRHDIQLHLAALLTYDRGRQVSKVPSETFDSLHNQKLVCGDPKAQEAFYDRRTRTLYVARDRSVVAELWRITGTTTRDRLRLYAARIQAGQPDHAWTELGLRQKDELDLSEGLGRSRLNGFAALFVAVRAAEEALAVPDVAAKWVPTESADAIVAWLGRRPSWLHALPDQPSPDGVLDALADEGIAVETWQQAREALGEKPHRFTGVVGAWRSALVDAVAQVRRTAAQDWDTPLPEQALKDLATAACPERVHRMPLDADLPSHIDAAVKAAGLAIDPARNHWEFYRDINPYSRVRDATHAVTIRLKEATALCPSMNPAPILQDLRLQRLQSDHAWAHWRVALARLAWLLKTFNWPCYDEMLKANAFKNLPPVQRSPKPAPEPDPRSPEPPEPTGPVDSPDPNADRQPVPPKKKKKKRKKKDGPPRRRKTPPKDHQERTGDRGERFFYAALKGWFAEVGRDWDDAYWVSEARERYGLPRGDDTLGYDFKVRDPGGRLTGFDDVLCHVEVKTTASQSASFPMTSNEWANAEACHRGEEEATYVLVRIHDNGDHLRIKDILVDPVQAKRDGVLALDATDYRVRVGARRAT